MWVQLLKYQRIQNKAGQHIMHYPGEMVYVKNKKVCAGWIKNEIAIDIRVAAKDVPDDTGILVLGNGRVPKWAEALELETAAGGASLPFAFTILWDPKTRPQGALIVSALKVISRHAWDLAVPIYSYHKLARDCGRPEERIRTKAVIHDLRVPVYNPGLMFVERNERTEALISDWIAEKVYPESDNRLAFMRALYHVKPYILPLPTLWIKPSKLG